MSKDWQQRENACNEDMQGLATGCKNLQQLASTCNDEKVILITNKYLQQPASTCDVLQWLATGYIMYIVLATGSKEIQRGARTCNGELRTWNND